MPDKHIQRWVAFAQSAEYVTTGVWPLLSIKSFEAITGPKADRWLVRTVGILVTVSGTAIALAAVRRRITPEIALLGAGSAAGLGAIDAWYSLRGRISLVYLADAFVQAAFLAGWVAASRGERRTLDTPESSP